MQQDSWYYYTQQCASHPLTQNILMLNLSSTKHLNFFQLLYSRHYKNFQALNQIKHGLRPDFGDTNHWYMLYWTCWFYIGKCATWGALHKHLQALKYELINFHLWINTFNVCVRYFVWNFKGYLWNSTQDILPIHWKMQFLYNVEILRALRF